MVNLGLVVLNFIMCYQYFISYYTFGKFFGKVLFLISKDIVEVIVRYLFNRVFFVLLFLVLYLGIVIMLFFWNNFFQLVDGIFSFGEQIIMENIVLSFVFGVGRGSGGGIQSCIRCRRWFREGNRYLGVQVLGF